MIPTAVAILELACAPAFCSCLPTGSPSEALAAADLVVAGQVVAMADTAIAVEEGGWRREWPKRRITIRVQERWKGAAEETITLLTGLGVGDCGFPFRVGGSYLIYAQSAEGHWATSICSRTRSLIDADEDLGVLGPAVPHRI